MSKAEAKARAEELLELVEQIAGQARAASIAEQLQHLLQHSPQSTVH